MSRELVLRTRFDSITMSKSGLEWYWIGFIAGTAENATSSIAVQPKADTNLFKCMDTTPATAAAAIGLAYD